MVNIKKLFRYGYLEIEGDEQDIWFVSDLHMYHTNIIRLSNRPFADIEEMSKVLVDNWNNVVKEDDIVFNLGDFCWSESYIIWAKVIDKLNGHQVLIKGNHDHPKTLQKLSEQYKLIDSHQGNPLFVKNLDKLFLIRERLELRHNKDRFLLDHFPQYSWVGSYHGVYHLHGHIHEKNNDISTTNTYNVSIERNLYRPLSLDEIKMGLKMQCVNNQTNYYLTNILSSKS